MTNTGSRQSDCERAGISDADQQAERRVNYLAAVFGIAMMLLALVTPFLYADRETSLGLTVVQIVVWACFCAAWIFQGYLAGKSGMGFDSESASNAGRKRRINWREALFYVVAFGPLCFAFIYVSHENTGYFGFNYVMMFVVAGFSTLIFPVWLASLYLIYQCVLWILLARAMWGGWMEMDDIATTFSGFLFSAMMFYMFRRERESRGQAVALSQELDGANRKLRAFSRQVEELAATQERNRIAREIHDTIGHSLTVVNMQIQTAKALLDTDPDKAGAFLGKAQEVTKKGLSDIRASVASLRQSPLDGVGLREAIEDLLASSFTNGTKTKLELIGEIRSLKPAVEAALYRSVQEALTNVRKHADASEVAVALDLSQPNSATVVIADNGNGCANVIGGFGIMGIRERIQLLDGRMDVSSSPGEGLRLSITVPT